MRNVHDWEELDPENGKVIARHHQVTSDGLFVGLKKEKKSEDSEKKDESKKGFSLPIKVAAVGTGIVAAIGTGFGIATVVANGKSDRSVTQPCLTTDSTADGINAANIAETSLNITSDGQLTRFDV